MIAPGRHEWMEYEPCGGNEMGRCNIPHARSHRTCFRRVLGECSLCLLRGQSGRGTKRPTKLNQRPGKKKKKKDTRYPLDSLKGRARQDRVHQDKALAVTDPLVTQSRVLLLSRRVEHLNHAHLFMDDFSKPSQTNTKQQEGSKTVPRGHTARRR